MDPPAASRNGVALPVGHDPPMASDLPGDPCHPMAPIHELDLTWQLGASMKFRMLLLRLYEQIPSNLIFIMYIKPNESFRFHSLSRPHPK